MIKLNLLSWSRTFNLNMKILILVENKLLSRGANKGNPESKSTINQVLEEGMDRQKKSCKMIITKTKPETWFSDHTGALLSPHLLAILSGIFICFYMSK